MQTDNSGYPPSVLPASCLVRAFAPYFVFWKDNFLLKWVAEMQIKIYSYSCDDTFSILLQSLQYFVIFFKHNFGEI